MSVESEGPSEGGGFILFGFAVRGVLLAKCMACSCVMNGVMLSKGVVATVVEAVTVLMGRVGRREG